MITYDDALKKLFMNKINLTTRLVKTCESLNFFLAEDIFAPMNLPPFSNSAVDGFAINCDEEDAKEFEVETILAAKVQAPLTLKKNKAAKIMTGAPLPEGANVVAMIENTIMRNNYVSLTKPLKLGENMRHAGEDIERGELMAKQGEKIDPQTIALLLGQGIADVLVFAPLKIKIICSGDELVEPGQALQFGQVYFLVGEMLKNQLAQFSHFEISLEKIPDTLEDSLKALKNSEDCEVIIFTGGMSKGDFDYGVKSFCEFGVEQIFHKGFWRPGKPLFFGKNDRQVFFGLPGNPVACFVGLEQFFKPWLKNCLGCENILAEKSGVLLNNFQKKSGFTFFARAKVNEFNELTILPQQGSHQLKTLSQANALVLLEAEKAVVKAGEKVQYFCI